MWRQRRRLRHRVASQRSLGCWLTVVVAAAAAGSVLTFHWSLAAGTESAVAVGTECDAGGTETDAGGTVTGAAAGTETGAAGAEMRLLRVRSSWRPLCWLAPQHSADGDDGNKGDADL